MKLAIDRSMFEANTLIALAVKAYDSEGQPSPLSDIVHFYNIVLKDINNPIPTEKTPQGKVLCTGQNLPPGRPHGL